MSIATEISRIQQAKADIKTAIEAKGVTVPSSATIDTYYDYVSQISGGGGTSYENEVKGIIDRSIQSIDIPDGVTSIGSYAFSYCTNLTSIDIPNGVTSIGQGAFNGCSGLTSCTIGSGVTSIGDSAFSYCTKLTSIDIPSGVTSIGSGAFSHAGDNGSKTLNLSSFDLSSVYPSTSFNSVFENSYIKGSITIPNNLLSGSTSGTSSTCYYLFNNAFVRDASLTINIYANNRIIPRNMCYFSNASTISTGNINIIVHGTPTFLSRQSFRLISGVGVGTQSVTFVDCETPPDAQAYTATLNSPFYGFTGIIYVPSSGLDAWKTKYTGVADKIQAIPNS